MSLIKYCLKWNIPVKTNFKPSKPLCVRAQELLRFIIKRYQRYFVLETILRILIHLRVKCYFDIIYISFKSKRQTFCKVTLAAPVEILQ